MLTAMPQHEHLAFRNTRQCHLASKVVAVWIALQISRRVCVSQNLCKLSCLLNASLPPSICFLTEWLTLHKGLM